MINAVPYTFTLAQHFEQVVETFAAKTAIAYPNGNNYSFAELNNIANRLAQFLRNNNIQQGDTVGIFNEKTINAYALMIACIKTGVIYTNLDNRSPWIRLERILNTCKPKAVFYDENPPIIFGELAGYFPDTAQYHLDKIDISSPLEIVKGFLDQNFHGDSPAYIMFTSGSTGFPKGAVISHSNLLHFIAWGKQTFTVTTEDVFTNVNPIYFDNSVFDFYISLFNGASLFAVDHELVKQPKKLVKVINQSGCTIWFSVPSLLVYLLTTKVLSPKDLPTITRISFGGEGFPKPMLKKLFEILGDRVTLFNVYGPTECTCICSSYIISESDFENMQELAPLGKMAPNFGYEILPADPVNPDFGELTLIGPCVGLGYYNDPARTAASFIQNPNRLYPQWMYKTGDLVLQTDDGNIHFKGRVDNQVKLMGYRIELEEIEAALSSYTFTNEAAVIYENIAPGLGQIKAFISLNSGQGNVTEIMEHLQSILPHYMMPKRIEILPILPKNQNGKIDRNQLKANA
jgi:D-alanine--poly(phosphoribitol) ligase subunit 1